MKHNLVTRSDSDGLYYLTTELTWESFPMKDDPGFLVPILGAIPRNRETAEKLF